MVWLARFVSVSESSPWKVNPYKKMGFECLSDKTVHKAERGTRGQDGYRGASGGENVVCCRRPNRSGIRSGTRMDRYPGFSGTLCQFL
jgi:hypothetical protein